MKHQYRLLFLIAALCLLSLCACTTGGHDSRETWGTFVNPHDENYKPCITHTFEDGICTACGAEQAYSEGLEFTVISPEPSPDDPEAPVGEPYCILTGKGTCTDKQIMIPPTHEGIPVTEIGSSAFYEDKNITAVFIPEGVKTMGEMVFYGCTSLVSVHLPTTMTRFGMLCFENCLRLTTVNLPDGITIIPHGAFKNCVGLTDIDLPESLVLLTVECFEGCRGLTEILLPEGVSSIERNTFKDCSGLTKLTLPSTLTSVDSFLEGCNSLKETHFTGTLDQWCMIEYSMPDNNPVSMTHNLYIDGEPLTGVVTIPEGATRISLGAFSGLTGVTGFILPKSLTEIGYNCMENCPDLEFIVIRSSPDLIYSNFHKGSTKMMDIYLEDEREVALSYVAYLAYLTLECGGTIHYGGTWTWGDDGRPISLVKQ